MSDITSREYFNVFIKTKCNCSQNLCDGDHMISYRPNSNNVIYLHHNTRYMLGVSNNHCNPILAVATIDSLSIGKFRIDSYSSCLIKRPISINRQLVFVDKCDQLSSMGILKHLQSITPGQIQVSVLPAAKIANYDIINYQKLESDSNLPSVIKKELDIRTSALAGVIGGTILGRRTSQNFRIAPHLQTSGKHLFTIGLLTGDPTRNSVICEEFSPLSKTLYNPDQIYEVVD